MIAEPQYEHTQKGGLHLILYGSAVGAFVIAWLCREDQPAMIIGCFAACTMVLACLCFQTLTVRDEGEHLVHCQGRKCGWHSLLAKLCSPDCFSGNTAGQASRATHRINLDSALAVRIGTDDPQGLAEFLKTKIAANGSSA